MAKQQTVKRAGAKYEAMGVLAMIVGVVWIIASSDQSIGGGLVTLGGFITFLVGRFK
jgi:hypothetical protein